MNCEILVVMLRFPLWMYVVFNGANVDGKWRLNDYVRYVELTLGPLDSKCAFCKCLKGEI